MKLTSVLVAALWAGMTLAAGLRAGEHPIPPPFGPYVNPSAREVSAGKSFRASDRIVGTYYFYWYAVETGEHITNYDGSDGLTDHPPTLKDFSYRSVAWHRKQLSDMEDAGIDLTLMVFWGAPSEQTTNTVLHWSYAGLPPLVQARDELVKAGRKPPRIGLFYDTSTLQHNAGHEHVDLTTDYGRRWFYATVRDFFSMIPVRHWAMIDERPVVLLYSASFARAHDGTFLGFTKGEFKKDFSGVEPYIAPQDSWRAQGDNICAWGGALGLKNAGIGELGPGYDHSAVRGRTPLIVERENGKFYEQSWLTFLRKPSNFVMLETWNEFHEGTDICESKEYGRQYINLTRDFVVKFKSRWQPEWPKGPLSHTNQVIISPGEVSLGLTLVNAEDGKVRVEQGANGMYWASANAPYLTRYIYFRIEDSFKWATTMDVTVEVEYHDLAPGTMRVDYDGEDYSAPFRGAYTRAPSQRLSGDESWKSARFRLTKGHFLNAQNGGADFRLAAEAKQFAVRKVVVTGQKGRRRIL